MQSFRVMANGTHLNRIGRQNYHIHIIMTVLYAMSLFNDTAQIVYSEPAQRTLPSTSRLPYEFALTMYSPVLGYQMMCVFVIVFWVAMLDTFPVALMKERLRNLGSVGNDLKFYKGLLECCERSEDCLRCVFCSMFLIFYRNNGIFDFSASLI